VSWEPGPRPAWVQHAIDGEGGPELAIAAAPFDAAQLVGEAVFRSGTDDFGGDSFVEPLDVLVDALEREADLHIVGRWRAREVVVRYLESRLRLTAALVEDPAIDDRRVIAPIVVTGSPRAGTSILHQLLATDPALRAPMAWEYWSPAPPPDPRARDADVRIPLADRDVRLTAALAPAFDGMHEQGARIPREDASAMGVDLRSDVLALHYPMPSYSRFLAADDMRSAYAWHQRVLQVLQYRFEEQTWVLKWPGHVNHLDVLLETYPDACIVVCHRDPLAMLSSVTSLTATIRWGHCNTVDYQELARELAEMFAAQCDRLVQWRARHADPEGGADRVVDVRFDEFMADPVATVLGVYEHFGIDAPVDAEERLGAHLAAAPQGRKGGHAHDFDALGLDPAELRARFASYMDAFGVDSEHA
jgi:hypothetical protein